MSWRPQIGSLRRGRSSSVSLPPSLLPRHFKRLLLPRSKPKTMRSSVSYSCESHRCWRCSSFIQSTFAKARLAASGRPRAPTSRPRIPRSRRSNSMQRRTHSMHTEPWALYQSPGSSPVEAVGSREWPAGYQLAHLAPMRSDQLHDVALARFTSAQRAAWQHVREAVRRRQPKGRVRVASILSSVGCPEAMFDAATDAIRRHARVVVHFHPDRIGVKPITVADALLEDGQYRSQFET